MTAAIEIRRISDIKAAQNGRLEGYAAVFNSDSQDLGGFVESIRPGAFTRSLKNANNILALYDHDRKAILGRVGAGTLRLEQDQRGLKFQIDLPDTSIGKDLAVLVGRGDVAGASFAFSVPKGGDKWSRRNLTAHRELIDVNLHEITVTADPAYLDTSVAKRRMPGMTPRLTLALKFLETV